MLACFTIQSCEELFNGAEVICWWLFRESFFLNTQLQLESLHIVFHDQGERMFNWTLWVNEKSKIVWFHTNDSRRFLPTLQYIHKQLLHHRYDQNYYISINSATVYTLLGLLAASIAQANILVSSSSCKQGANECISQAGHTKTKLLLRYCRALSRVLSHSPRATPDLNLGYCLLVGISYVRETQQLEK